MLDRPEASWNFGTGSNEPSLNLIYSWWCDDDDIVMVEGEWYNKSAMVKEEGDFGYFYLKFEVYISLSTNKYLNNVAYVHSFV